ncbi:helix-turn-helix domain-containing protein [Streptomyces sp. NPDC090077]|uniref:AraC-like ligand-binding domain-containing protein n=1 Tax=Streptomyces sp. NPDC090077 TaxID=3365938 RepID=UPI0037FBBD31
MSAAAVPAAERMDWFADLIADQLVPTAISSESRDSFWAEATALDLGRVQVSTFDFSPLRSTRTAAHVRRGDPEQYQLGLVTHGSMSLVQNRSDSGPFSGDMVLWDTSRPMDSDTVPGADGLIRGVTLSFPKDAMPLRGARVERLLAQRIPGGYGMGAILAQYLRSLTAHAPDCGPAELERIGAVALDLVGTCLAGRLGDEGAAAAPARETALLARIDAFVDHNLGDPRLTPAAVAARHGISLRRLQLLLRDRGESPAARIRQLRLERCRADLADPGLLGRPVRAVAGRWGFTDPSVFSRAFRDAYGTSPTEYRREAVREAAVRRISGARGGRPPGE